MKDIELLLIDLDYTIRKPKTDSKFINKPENQEPIPKVFNLMNELNIPIIGCSNQAGDKEAAENFQCQFLWAKDWISD